MFDVGLAELVVIAVVAIFVFGPDRLPDLAKQAGVMLRKARDFANAARDELRDLDPRTIVRKHIMEAMEEAESEQAATRTKGLRPLDDGEVPPYDSDAT